MTKDYLGNDIRAGDIIHHAIRIGDIPVLTTSRVRAILNGKVLIEKDREEFDGKKFVPAVWKGVLRIPGRAIVDLRKRA